jgi:hypothetical protein
LDISTGRVEETTILFRLRHTVFQGFPRMWLKIRMPCRTMDSPLVKPDVRLSRIRLSPQLSPQARAGSCAAAVRSGLSPSC